MEYVRVSAQWASGREVARWFVVSAAIAALMLVGVTVSALLLPAAPDLRTNLLNTNAGLYEAAQIMRRNLAVLGIHFCACLAGAIVARPHRPLPRRLRWLNPLHKPIPSWAGQVSLTYALVVTVTSVVLQTTAIGFTLADVAAGVGRSPVLFCLLILPHAVPELTALFLPLGLFLLRARSGADPRLGRWAWQSVAIALPLLLVAAAIETWLTPQLLHEVLGPVSLHGF